MSLPLNDTQAKQFIAKMRATLDSIETKMDRHGGLAACVRVGAASTISGQVHEVSTMAAVLERRIDSMAKKAASAG
jgi:hypothetical protein